MIKELPPLFVPLTPDVAGEHKALQQINGDRKLLPKNVKHLKDAIQRGLFHSPDWAVVWFRGEKLRINGKHSSHVLTEANGNFPQGLNVCIKQFSADTEDELALLFDQFDHPEGVRTKNQSLQVHKSRIAKLQGISNTKTSAALAGLKWILADGKIGQFERDDTNQLMHEYADFIAWAAAFVGTRRMARAGVVAAMFSTWMVDAECANTFWELVRNQSHEDFKDGSRVLGKFLEISVYSPMEPGTKAPWDSRAFYSKCIHGWNAWRDGHSTDLKYHSKSPLPKPK